MRTEEEIKDIIYSEHSYKEIEKIINIKIQNGQCIEGIRKALLWVLNK